MATIDTRFGGCDSDHGYRFEVSGGAPALDFVNTLDQRRGEPRELLSDYRRLLDWSEQAGVLAPAARARLAKAAAREPRRADAALRRARELRETLFALFSDLTHRALTGADLKPLNAWIRKAAAHARLAIVDGAIVRDYADDKSDFAAMLWPVVESAAALLADEELRTRIKLCEGECCAWAFVDRSRQGNKRWCDMSVCGNRAKAKRHRQRKSGAGA